MKYIFSLLCLGMFFAADLGAANRVNNIRDLDANGNGIYEPGEVDPNACYQTGPCVCYCPVTRFCEKKYCTKKCVKEPYVVKKKCCRYVDKPYQKKCCRYVDQAYQKKCTRMVPEYYTKQHCRYIKVPQYYEKTYCRKVPECYTKTCTRKVPEYYYETCSRKVPEYYTECETKCRNKWVTEEKCCYQPYTCIEKRCIDCPPQNGCRQNGWSNNSQNAMSRNSRNGYSNSQDYIAESDYVSENVQVSDADLNLADKINSGITSNGFLSGTESINVQIDNGNVTLTGYVSSTDTKESIGSFVSAIPGVANLTNNIQVQQ